MYEYFILHNFWIFAFNYFLNHILHGSFPLAQNNNLRDELNGDELNEWQKQKPHKRLINITDQN